MTHINEPTLGLCIWALERNGFEVEVISGNDSLASKLKKIFLTVDEDFLRVDADIIVNRKMTPTMLNSLSDPNIWWWQFLCFDWFKQDTNHAMSFIKREALPALRSNIDRFKKSIRPETDCSRIEEFYEPRRFATHNEIMGLHGYGNKNLKPVMELKAKRGQSHLYDFELTEELNKL